MERKVKGKERDVAREGREEEEGHKMVRSRCDDSHVGLRGHPRWTPLHRTNRGKMMIARTNCYLPLHYGMHVVPPCLCHHNHGIVQASFPYFFSRLAMP